MPMITHLLQKTKNHAAGLAAAALMMTTATCGAQTTIVDNLSNTHSAQLYASPGQPLLAQEFTTGSLGYDLGNVVISAFDAGGGTNAPLGVAIWTGNATQPGSLDATLTGTNPTGTTPADYTFSPTGTVALAANTPYWIVLNYTGTAGSYGWVYSLDTSSTGPGTMGGIAFNNGSWTYSASANFLSQVNSAAVPEPGMYTAIFGAGMLAVAGWRSSVRKNRRA